MIKPWGTILCLKGDYGLTVGKLYDVFYIDAHTHDWGFINDNGDMKYYKSKRSKFKILTPNERLQYIREHKLELEWVWVQM